MSRRTFKCNNIQQNVMSQTPNLKNPVKPKKTHRAGFFKKKTRVFTNPVPQLRFSHLHVYLVGSLQCSNNLNNIFTITDHTSKWTLSETFAAACTKASTFTWIYRFGCPK
jgi:hypothetical protein